MLCAYLRLVDESERVVSPHTTVFLRTLRVVSVSVARVLLHLFDVVLGDGDQLLHVLEDDLVLGGGQDAVAERSGESLSAVVHEVDVLKLQGHEAVQALVVAG